MLTGPTSDSRLGDTWVLVTLRMPLVFETGPRLHTYCPPSLVSVHCRQASQRGLRDRRRGGRGGGGRSRCGGAGRGGLRGGGGLAQEVGDAGNEHDNDRGRDTGGDPGRGAGARRSGLRCTDLRGAASQRVGVAGQAATQRGVVGSRRGAGRRALAVPRRARVPAGAARLAGWLRVRASPGARWRAAWVRWVMPAA
jgi:hypothetical protein